MWGSIRGFCHRSGPSTPQDLSLATGLRLWVTGLHNINSSDLLFCGNHDSAAPSIVTGGKTQTRQQGDASGDVRRKLKVLSPITRLRATRTVFKFLAIFAFSHNDFELKSSFWQSWPWYYTLKPDYAKDTPTLQLRPCYYTCYYSLGWYARLEPPCKHVKGWNILHTGREGGLSGLAWHFKASRRVSALSPQ